MKLNSMFRQYLFVATVPLVLFAIASFSCASFPAKQNQPVRAADLQEEIQEHRFNAKVSFEVDPRWGLQKIPVKSATTFGRLQFVDALTGYAVDGKANLYKTIDGGVSWNKMKTFPGSSISSILFPTEDVGLVATHTIPESSISGENALARIFRTVDGGNSWTQVFEGRSLGIDSLSVSKSRVVFAAGSKSAVVDSVLEWSPLFMSSSDGGTSWNDISGGLIQEFERGNRINGMPTDIIADDNLVTVVTHHGSIISSDDLGKTWSFQAGVDRQGFPYSVRSLGWSKNGELLIYGSSSSMDHGTASFVASWSKASGWKIGLLPRYFLSDAVLLSSGEIVAVGFVFKDGHRSPRTGIVLTSSDNGENWQVIQEGGPENSFNSISRLSEKRLFVTETGGDALVVERKRAPF